MRARTMWSRQGKRTWKHEKKREIRGEVYGPAPGHSTCLRKYQRFPVPEVSIWGKKNVEEEKKKKCLQSGHEEGKQRLEVATVFI